MIAHPFRTHGNEEGSSAAGSSPPQSGGADGQGLTDRASTPRSQRLGDSRRAVLVAMVSDAALAADVQYLGAASGVCVEVVEDATALRGIIDRWPALIVVDLGVRGWETTVRWAKTQPHTKAIPVVALGRGTEPETVHLAHAVGCDHLWAHADLIKALPDLLNEVLHPPTRWLAGWDAPTPPGLCSAAAQFNAGRFWECHETLEELWVAERQPIRDLYQGVLQVGVAFHHLQQRNYAGAIKMFRRGLPRLRGLPEVSQGLHVAQLATEARSVHDRAVSLGAERIDELDLTALPRITLVGCR